MEIVYPSELLKNKIGNTNFTVEFVLDCLKKNDKNFQEKFDYEKLKNVKIKKIGVGEGFLSHVYRCTFCFIDCTEEFAVILKVPTSEYLDVFECSLDDDFYARLHQCECDFYNDIAPLLDIAIPKVYDTYPVVKNKHEGYILMDYVEGAVQKISSNMNLNQIKLIVQQLAKFHARILLADEKIWKGRFIENQYIIGFLSKVVEKYFVTFFAGKDNLTKYSKLVKNPEFFHYLFCQSHFDLNVKPVLCHGDLWNSNIMWKVHNGQITDELLAIVDWQGLMEGSPMMDLTRLLATGTSAEIRRHVETFIIDYYLELLAQELGDVKVPYTKEQLQTCYSYGILAYGFKFIFTGVLCMEEIDPNDPEVELKRQILKDRCTDLIEDADKLLSGPLKHLYEKYGQ
uniref:CHK kinase-like domain-containing protein n=1 Tax=Panagrolaimus sp. JU765 TaxID=591449 RepID=A0AC34R361_9BILA